MDKINSMKTALKKWETVKQRPQDNSKELLDFRIQINNRIFPSVNPNANIIRNWEISQEMLQTTKVHPSPPVIFVQNEESLEHLANTLKQQQVFAFDHESNSFGSFTHLICLLQISTPTQDFVIDTLLLFGKINSYLREPFENPCLLKITHGNMQVRALQRDFNIFSTGVLDLQDLHYKLYNDMKQPGLAYLASKILGDNILKTSFANLADWRLRPLPNELLEYAALDSRTIIKCWDFIRLQEKEKILSLNFEISKMYTEKVFSFPKSIDPENLWNSYIKTLRWEWKRIFNTVGQKKLFFEISKYILNKARVVDCPPHLVMDVETVGLICRCMPKSPSQMFKILFSRQATFAGMVSTSVRVEIVKIIDAHREHMHTPENARVILDPPRLPRAEKKRVFPITRAEAMQLEITQEELDNQSTYSSDSDIEIDYDAKTINQDLDDWNDPKRKKQVSTADTSAEVFDKTMDTKTEPSSSLKDMPSSKATPKRGGKVLRVKRVFHFAAKLGLCEEDIKVNLPRFPKSSSKPNQIVNKKIKN